MDRTKIKHTNQLEIAQNEISTPRKLSAFGTSLKLFSVAIHRSLLAICWFSHLLRTVPTNSTDFQASTCKIWKPFAPFVQENAWRLTALGKITIDNKLTPPLAAFHMGDVSGKVWPTVFTAQQVEIYLKVLLGFATYGASSPASIYWCIVLCVYSPCASILALCVLSVKLHNSGVAKSYQLYWLLQF